MSRKITAPKKKKRTISAETAKLASALYDHKEVTWTAEDAELTAGDLAISFNWYRRNLSDKDAKTFFIDHVKNNQLATKEVIATLRSVHEYDFGTVGFLARMVSNGAKLPEQYQNKIADLLNVVSEIGATLKAERKEIADAAVTTKTAGPTIQERIKLVTSGILGEIDEEVDGFLNNNFESDFDAYKFFQSNGTKAMHSRAIIEDFTQLNDELTAALLKTDEELAEGYDCFSKKELTKFVNFVSGIVADAVKWERNIKVTTKTRKTRKTSAPSTDKIIAKLKFQKQDNDLKIVSVDPKTIIGATELFTYNTKRNILTHFVSDIGSLNIKGTNITGFNTTKSESKKLRKPSDTIKTVLNGKKRVLSKVMGDLTTKGKEASARINEETILLKVVK